MKTAVPFAVMETYFAGPVKVRMLRDCGGVIEVEVVKQNPQPKGYSAGLILMAQTYNLWVSHKFIGMGHRSLWEGRPDFSKIPIDTVNVVG